MKVLVEYDRTCVQKLDKDGRTPVYVACYHGNYEILKLLVENGGNLANMIILLHTSCFTNYFLFSITRRCSEV